MYGATVPSGYPVGCGVRSATGPSNGRRSPVGSANTRYVNCRPRRRIAFVHGEVAGVEHTPVVGRDHVAEGIRIRRLARTGEEFDLVGRDQPGADADRRSG